MFSVITSAMVATPASVSGAYVGTSGFSYPSWRGEFYPEKARPSEFLQLYSERLPSVELNNTFYKLPSEEQFRAWAERTPPDFRFAVKLNRRITHFGRLELLPTFSEHARLLGDRLGPILVQFPPTRTRDDGLLRLLLGSLDPELEYAFEFRHESWADVDVPVRVNALDGDAPFRYLRLREPPYDDDELRAFASTVRDPAYVYVRHEDEPTAPATVERLRSFL